MRFFYLAVALAASIIGSSANAAILTMQNTGGAGWTTPAGMSTPIPLAQNNPSWGTVPGALWLGTQNPASSKSDAPGPYNFSTTFTPDAGDIGVNLAFNLLYDDTIEVLLNSTIIYSDMSPGYANPFKSVTRNNALGFKANEVNTLTFRVYNGVSNFDVNPVGVNVAFTTQETFKENPAIPEPASIALWAGVCGLGLVMRRRNRFAKS
jgi:hypothetical protein